MNHSMLHRKEEVSALSLAGRGKIQIDYGVKDDKLQPTMHTDKILIHITLFPDRKHLRCQ